MNQDVLTRNNVRVFGRGTRPMMFAHGFGCDQNMWRFVAPAFEATHRVVLFDHVGAGGSDPAAFDSARHARLEGYAQDVVEIVAALGPREAQLASWVGAKKLKPTGPAERAFYNSERIPGPLRRAFR